MVIEWSNIWSQFKSQLNDIFDKLDENDESINQEIGKMLPYKEVFRQRVAFSAPDGYMTFSANLDPRDADVLLMYCPGGEVTVSRTKNSNADEKFVLDDGDGGKYFSYTIYRNVEGWGTTTLSATIPIPSFNYMFHKKDTSTYQTINGSTTSPREDGTLNMLYAGVDGSYEKQCTLRCDDLFIYVIGYVIDTTKIEG